LSETTRNARIFRFGLFELDSRTLVLRKDGRTEPRLREQTLQVLLVLLNRPGQIVSREELSRMLWPADTFVDFDHGLNTAMNQLRNALGDSASNPRFVETLPRRGYRFIAPVEMRIEGSVPTLAVGNDYAATQPANPNSQKILSGSPSDSSRPVIEVVPAASTSDDIETAKQKHSTILSDPRELPQLPRHIVRLLFSLIQFMYLIFYVVSLARIAEVEKILAELGGVASFALIALIVTAAVGIPIRLYLLAASSFNYQGLTRKFQKLFPFVFPLDELWSLVPFLIADQVGFGLAIAMTAALLYLPFAQRSLLHMGFSPGQKSL
jgi:DNA-binding winged helix-turn-helix (wHTH) protein